MDSSFRVMRRLRLSEVPRTIANPFASLTPPARRALGKILGAVGYMIPSKAIWDTPGFAEDARRYCEEQALTPEEEAEFRRFFPDGFFGGIKIPHKDQPASAHS